MAVATIRAATQNDLAAIVGLVRELAVFEKLADRMVATEADFGAHLFCENPPAEAIVAELDGQVVGMALFIRMFSTFLGKPGIWLEDLIVKESQRGRGIGRQLITRVTQIAVERNYGRVEWAVLDWNEKAIAFYKSLGAEPQSEWIINRLTGPALAKLGKQ